MTLFFILAFTYAGSSFRCSLLQTIYYLMNQLISKYHYDPDKHIGTPYDDAEVKNHSFKATRLKDNRSVHLVIYSSSKPGQIASYFKKINKLAEVKHRNITPILQCIADIDKNKLFVVLEWSQGYCFGECLSKQTALSWQNAVSLIADVSDGLAQIHNKGLVHSFVNIENIEIYQGRARISFRSLIYKTYYLAPEVKQTHQKNKQTDLFSLGVCLYKFLFGTLPFKHKSQEEYIKHVKTGIGRKMSIPNTNFPRAIPENIQQLFNTMCHYVPKQRLKSLQILKKVSPTSKQWNKQLLSASLGQNYHLLSLNSCQQEQAQLTVVNFDSKKILSMDIISHNLTEISTYVEEVILPFKNASNNYFANVKDFYTPTKKSLAIVYDYCSQGSLKQYRKVKSFQDPMIEEVDRMLKSVLINWTGQYRLLCNEQVLVKKGKPVLKFPPFPTEKLIKKLEESKSGLTFIAPQVSAGIQSQSADSWSLGVLEYWMRFDAMPTFNADKSLIIKQKDKLTPEQIQEITEIIQKKHTARKNLFPLDKKPLLDRKISSDSVSSGESPRLSGVKGKDGAKSTRQTKIRPTGEIENQSDQEDADNVDLMPSIHLTQPGKKPDLSKQRRHGRRGTTEDKPGRSQSTHLKIQQNLGNSQDNQGQNMYDQYQFDGDLLSPALKVNTNRQIERQRGKKLKDQKQGQVGKKQKKSGKNDNIIILDEEDDVIDEEEGQGDRNHANSKRKSNAEAKKANQKQGTKVHGSNQKSKGKNVQKNKNNEQDLAGSNGNQQSINRLTNFAEDSQAANDKANKKNNRFPTFNGSVQDKNSSPRRDSTNKKPNKDAASLKNSKQRRDTQVSQSLQQMDLSAKIFKTVANQGWKLSIAQKHWSKPIRVIIKGIIACIIYMFFFYFNFLTTTGSLLKSRYDYVTKVIHLRSDSLTVTPTINFTLVTRTPLQTYNQLNNQTLTYVRDVIQCVTNDYNVQSNVVEIISGSSFGTYQAFGIIVVLVNLIAIFLILAKLDLPKAFSLCLFDQHFYVPLYSWILINMALASLTSCTYLIYGGLFSLQLDPCLSRPAFPSLMYILKKMPGSFAWRFIWIYIGIVIAYIIIGYLIVKPKTRMHKYLYVVLFLLYLAGVGSRAMGTYGTSKEAVMGACGELLSILVGLPLIAIDLIFSCKLRKIQKPSQQAVKQQSQIDVNMTQQNFNITAV